MLAGEILRSFYAHTELATCGYRCDFTPGRRVVQYLRHVFYKNHLLLQ